jgi:peptidoglycan/xylan/chitin deacetylase (PgdA/CDA1 family)
MRAIFTFHSIDDKGSVISCRPRYLSRLLEELAARDVPVLNLGTLLKPGTLKGVAITFDDGMRSVYRNALPIIREHGVPAHMFLATDAVGSGKPWPRNAANGPIFDMLNWGELEKLHETGVLIESHTHTHPDMRTLTAEQMTEECERADTLIDKRLGRRPKYFAYPFGYHNKAVRAFVRDRYQGAVTTELRVLGVRENRAALPRIDTYYLQSEMRIRNIDSLAMRGYLAARNILRTLKGSQCVAGCD